MGLSDRLAAATRHNANGSATATATEQERPNAAGPAGEGPGSAVAAASGLAARRKPKAATGTDPFRDLKRVVHARLVESIGPKLYDANMTQSELEQQVRLALQTTLADTDIPMTSADRTRIRRSPTTSSDTGPSSPFSATRACRR
jgi:pilus assembly protein CpaF